MGKNKTRSRDISTPKISISAKNKEQKEMIRVIDTHDITFVKGFPGSGKTYVSVGYGLQHFFNNDFDQIIFTRPVVEAGGERLGYLPGNMHDKIDPYMIPIFETLSKITPPDVLHKIMPKHNGNGNESPIRVLPLAYMRGVSFDKSYILADEMQNATSKQIRMILTRLGEGSKMVICGDVHQTDISSKNGLSTAFDLLKDIEGIGFVTLSQDAVMRHPLVKKVEQKYRSSADDI